MTGTVARIEPDALSERLTIALEAFKIAGFRSDTLYLFVPTGHEVAVGDRITLAGSVVLWEPADGGGLRPLAEAYWEEPQK